MASDIRHTLRQTLIYGMSNLAIKAAGLVIIPLYTSTLSVESYGKLVILEIFAQFAVGIVSFQIPSALLRLGSNLPKVSEQKKLYTTSLGLLAVLAGIFAICFIPMTGVISELIFSSKSYEAHLKIIGFSIILEVFGLLPLQLIRIREKSILYFLFVCLKLTSLTVLVWYLVVHQNGGVYGAVQAIMYSNLIFLLATLPIQIRNLSANFSKDFSNEIYRYSGPLIFTTVSSLLLTLSDRVIIKIFGQFDDVGIYALAYKIGSLSNLLIVASFSLGFLPIAFKKFVNPDFKSFFAKTLNLYLGLTVVLTVFISVFGKELTKVLSSNEPSYWLASTLVPIIAFIFIFKALNNYFLYIFLLAKETKYHATITVIGVLLNIALNFLLIPSFGLYGAIAATGMSYFAMMMIAYNRAQHLVQIEYELNRVFLLLASCAGAIGLALLVNDASTLYRVASKSIIILLYFIFIYRFVARADEKKKIAELIKSVEKQFFR